MRRLWPRASPDRRSLRWAALLLGGGALAAVLLVIGVPGEQGSPLDGLFTHADAQDAATPPPQESAPLATVRLRVEGMVCSG